MEKEAVNNEVPYTPQMYEAHIDRLALELVSDLKNGIIDERVFADTYAKYQKLKVDNANCYLRLSEEVRKLVDGYSSQIFLPDFKAKNYELTQRIVELELKIECLKSENASLKGEIERLKRAANPFAYPYEPWGKRDIYYTLEQMSKELQKDE